MSNRTASTNHASLSDTAYARHNIPTSPETDALIARLRAEGRAGMEAIKAKETERVAMFDVTHEYADEPTCNTHQYLTLEQFTGLYYPLAMMFAKTIERGDTLEIQFTVDLTRVTIKAEYSN